MNLADVDRRIDEKLAGLIMAFEIVTDISINDDGTGSGTARDGSAIDFEFCGGAGGFKSLPLDGSAAGVVIKVGGEGASAVMVGWRDRQYERSLDKGEGAIVSAQGAYAKANKAGVLELNGTDYSGIKTEDLFGDLKTFITAVIADLASAAAAPASAYAASVNTTSLFSKMVTGNGAAYKSAKVKSG